jgi:catecholate siderophore receptor
MSHNVRLKLRPLSAALIAALGIPAAFPARAEEPAVPAGATVLPEVQVRGQGEEKDYAPGVTTIGRTPTPVRDVPQSVTVINRAVMDAQGASTLKDALRNVPGITISAGEGGQIGDNINIRGYSARTDLFLDGFRDRGQYTRDTFFLDAVEVLKGPSSMLFGRGSTGGVINQVSKQPSLRDRNEVALGVGTEAYYRTTADVNHKMSDTSAFRVAALAHTNESTRDVVEAERYGIAPSLRFGIGTPTEVGVSLVSQRSREIPDYGFPFATGGTVQQPARPIDVRKDNFYGFTDDKFDQDVDVLTARIEHKISPTLSVRNQTQYSSARIDAAPTRMETFNGTLFPRNRLEREIDDSSLFNQTDLIAKLQTGWIRHTVIAGTEIGRDWYKNQAFDWIGEPGVTDPTSPVYAPMPSSAVRSPTTLTENNGDTRAVYVNDALELNQRWKLVAGLRWDRFAFDSKVTNNAGAVTTDVRQNDRMTSYRSGVIYQPSEVQSYYVAYGTSFNPSAETLTVAAANQNVDPEKNRSFEVGAKWDLAQSALSFTTALFRVDKTNARNVDPITGVTTLDGSTRVDGFEIGAIGRLSSNWQLFAGYTYLDGKILELTESGNLVRNGNVLPNTPEHTASLWAIYTVGKEWEIGGGTVYASERLVNNANTAAVDGYTRYDATLAYHQRDYDLRLNLLNLSDERYFDVASGARAVPAAGRAAVATWTYRFR